jgi:ion channel POLLUX/CASTOR
VLAAQAVGRLRLLNRHSFSARLRYAFDNFMARGTIALIGGLFVISVLFILLVSAAVLISGTLREAAATQGIDFAEMIWISLLRTLDPGTMGGDTGSVPFVLAMLTVTLGGIFIVATLIGVISSGIESKLSELRKGRSQVLERGHTVILGWSSQIFEIIPELVAANANKRRQCIVVLAERDKVEMEDEIRQRVQDTRTTRVICRSGSPIELDDLRIASIAASRAVIVLSPEVDDPDSEVIKTLLALSNEAFRAADATFGVVAEIRNARNVDVARLAGRGDVRLVLGGALIGRIAAQTCRQPGLSVVYMDLLDFAGDEIYFAAQPDLAGRTFGEALLGYRDSSLIGIAPATGAPVINPSMERVLGADDRLIFIARDDDTIYRTAAPAGTPIEDAIVVREHARVQPDATLLLGWNARTPAVLLELDRYVAPGSRLTVIAQGPGVAEEIEAVAKLLQRLTLEHRPGDTNDRHVLDAAIAQGHDHVVIMSYSNLLEAQRADARTLVTLLHLRDIEQQRGESFTIVSEMLDLRNRSLAAVTRADDFIVSKRLVSLAMSQLAENPQLSAVFDELFSEEGAEIYLKPIADYVALDRDIDFYTVVESARRRAEVAVGYRLVARADDPAANYGVTLNPDKAATIRFAAADRVIVLARE